MSKFHAVVWLDHQEARVFHFDVNDVEKLVIHPEHPKHKLHKKAGSGGSGNAKEDQEYYHHVAEALKGAEEILIVGPGQAKLELMKHFKHHDAVLVDKIVGIETIDHPSDNQIVAYARKYFKAVDKMLAQL